jgi:hypothetical protein
MRDAEERVLHVSFSNDTTCVNGKGSTGSAPLCDLHA